MNDEQPPQRDRCARHAEHRTVDAGQHSHVAHGVDGAKRELALHVGMCLGQTALVNCPLLARCLARAGASTR